MRLQSIFVCLLFSLAIGLMGCGNNNGKKLKSNKPNGNGFDTITYTIKTITRDDDNCDSAKEKNCRIINIRYHFFDSHPVLNDSVKSLLLAIYPFERSGSASKPSLEGQADEFMEQYRKFRKEPYSEGRKYELISSTKVLTESGDLFTMQLDSYTYSGGAHGASFTRFFNYDVKSKKMVHLQDVLNEGFKDSLNVIAEQIFKKNEGLDVGKPLPSSGYFFENDKFSLNDNYVFTPQGIMFLYNQYEIKPYAAGQTKLLIPYDLIKKLMKPGTVLDQFSNSQRK